MPQIINDTTYHDDTPSAVINVLERARLSGCRVRIHYGYTKDKDGHTAGEDWYEEWSVTGRVGRSMGPAKVPLILANRRSSEGPAILDHCIVRIRDPRKCGPELYRHPSYSMGKVTIRRLEDSEYKIQVQIDGKPHAGFKTEAQAKRWLYKMGFPQHVRRQVRAVCRAMNISPNALPDGLVDNLVATWL